jgi:pyridoxamine 5'-phosphate oxidase
MSETELTSGDFTEAAEPFRLFAAWLDEATKSEINDPNGVALATVDAEGMPNVRMVLLKGFDESGFVFYTNFESAKGREILGSMKAAMCFHWKSLRRQVRARGPVEIVTEAEADAYYWRAASH